jgi:protein-disulfide isomerase
LGNFGILGGIIRQDKYFFSMEEQKPMAAEQQACASGCDQCGEDRGAWIVSGSILLGSLIVAASILVSVKPGVSGGSPTGVAPLPAGNNPTAQAPAGPQQATVSLDDDPVLGDRKKAKVAIVEFSDFECPFCKQFHQTTYNDLVKEYVDTGKAVLSFRDYPLPFHEPKASVAANAAQCVKQAKGDAAFFQFSKLYFENSQTNGKGLPEGKMDDILRQVGVNVAAVNQCTTSEKFKDEIAKDMSDGQAAGVSGTPSFVIGKLGADGKVDGELVVGALPLAQFKSTIEKYLK